jgi:putative transposase
MKFENIVTVMLNSFTGIVKRLLKNLPRNDYPVLNTRLFVLIWLYLIFDKSLTSLRDLFFRLNHSGIAVDLSTFSKASKHRNYQPVARIYTELNREIKKEKAIGNTHYTLSILL